MAGTEKYLEYIATERFESFLGSMTLYGSKKEYLERFESELKMVCDLGYADYFLIVWDIIEFAKKNNILCGPARGSVAGSLLAYIIGITSIDPIRFDLMFERFMNPVRSKTDPPDVDMDFQSSRREEIRQYIIEKYGEDRVVPIGSIDVMYASSAIRDVFRQMGLSVSELNQIIANKLSGVTLEEAYDGMDDFREFIDGSDENKKAFDIACNLQMLARHRTVHPAGLIIAPDGVVSDHVPVVKAKGNTVSQWKDTHVAKLGLLKLDILGLSTLDIIQHTIDQIELQFQIEINLDDIELDDECVLERFNSGDTLTVFQFETPLLRHMSMKMGVESFNDLVNITTITRPASLVSGVTEKFVRRKHGEEEVEYLHSLLEETLSETYGLPIFQEQFMRMAHVVGGIPLADTEIMRDAIKKFKRGVMSSYKEKFVAGAVKNGATEETALEMWNEILSASGYSYNKAHATSYSVISYWCMWFKVHFDLQWYASCLRFAGSVEKVRAIGMEAIERGIKIIPVDLNASETNYSSDGEGIIAGFSSVKGIGEKSAARIVENQPYESKSVESLMSKNEKRNVNKKVMDSLRKAGAFGESSPSEMREVYGFLPVRFSVDFKRIKDCRMCELSQCRKNVVPGSGSRGSRIMFVGEAPGREEDSLGIPFVGKAGEILDTIYLKKIGLERDQVFVTNIVKCRPTKDGRNGKPSDEQIDICSTWLEREIELVDPSIVVMLGSYPLRAVSSERSVLETNGSVVQLRLRYSREGRVGFSIVHPAYFLRNRSYKDELYAGLKCLKKLIEADFHVT